MSHEYISPSEIGAGKVIDLGNVESNYKYRAYPKMLHHPTLQSRVVNSEEERSQLEATDEQWSEKPYPKAIAPEASYIMKPPPSLASLNERVSSLEDSLAAVMQTLQELSGPAQSEGGRGRPKKVS